MAKTKALAASADGSAEIGVTARAITQISSALSQNARLEAQIAIAAGRATKRQHARRAGGAWLSSATDGLGRRDERRRPRPDDRAGDENLAACGSGAIDEALTAARRTVEQTTTATEQTVQTTLSPTGQTLQDTISGVTSALT